MNAINEIVRPGLKERVGAVIEDLRCRKCEGWGYDHVSQLLHAKFVECDECHGTGIKGMPLLKHIGEQTSQWIWDPKTNILENPKYGRIQVMMVFDPETGKRFEAPVYTESFGEIDIVANDNGEIALVVQNRPAVIPVEILNKHWEQSPPRIHYFSIRQGMTMLELPRGFSQGIMHEGEEEVGYKILAKAVIGNVNSNTAVFATSPIVAVGKAYKVESDLPPDPGEKILKVLWAKPEELRKAPTVCGFTMASLWLLRAWALEQEDPFWRKIGEKL